MQTITLDPKAHRAPAHPAHPHPGSLVDLPLIAPQHAGKKPGNVQATTGPAPETSTHAELDAMLVNEPGLGAVRGLRVALLFNAGLALSGLMAYEIWSMLAQ